MASPGPQNQASGSMSRTQPVRPRLLLVSLMLIAAITALVSSLGAPLVPALAKRWSTPLADAQWALTVTILVAVLATPTVGRLASGRRRRPVLLISLGVVTLGCLVSALAPSLLVLLLGRALQGIGLALAPVAFAIARESFPPHRSGAIIALLSVTAVAGAGLGYPVTAQVAEHFGLDAAFGMGAVLMALTTALTAVCVPGAAETPGDPVDWVGGALAGVGLLGLLLAISRGELWGWTSPYTLITAVVGVVLLAVFVRHTLRTPHPLVDLRLATRPGLANPNLVVLVAGIGMYSLLTLSVIVVQSEGDFGLGESIAAAGWVLVPYSVLALAGSWLSQQFRRYLGTRNQLSVGCLIFMLSTLSLAWWHDSLWQVLVAMALGGLGSGFTFSSLPVLMIPHLPPSETASALALNQVLRYVGFAVGSASSITLMHLFGGITEAGFRGTLWVFAGLWLVITVSSWALDRHQPSPARDAEVVR